MQTQPTTPSGGDRCRSPWWRTRRTREISRENRAIQKPSSINGDCSALTEAKTPLGVTDRALSVLHALLSFHQETALTLRPPIRAPATKTGRAAAASSCSRPIGNCRSAPMAWPRNAASPSGVPRRRWTDHSPRFPQRQTFRPKRAGWQIESAFGFDLTPLVARAEEIENLAEEVRAENKAIRLPARTHHAAPPRYRQDDRDRAGGGRSRRLAGPASALCGAIEPLRAQFIACRSGGVGERTCRAER